MKRKQRKTGKIETEHRETENSKKHSEEEYSMVTAPTVERTEVELKGKIRVSTKGQIVIPVEVRKAAGIEEGGRQELKYTYKDGKLILEVEKYLTADELLGFFDTEEDNGDFVLDLDQAREERAIEILNKRL